MPEDQSAQELEKQKAAVEEAARKLVAKRESAAERSRRSRQRKKETKQIIAAEKKSVELANFSSTEELSEKAAKQVIANEWGISREHIIDTVHKWGTKAAEQLKLAQTAFYWSNGPVQTRASIETNEAKPLAKPEGDNIVVGEIVYKREIFALYHFVEAWRKDAIPTFEGYLAERRSCKTDGTINRGNKYFGKDFHEQPHQRWDDMFIRWNPDGLQPDYDQESAKKWLGSQSENKKRVLVACRNSYKSNFTLVYLVGAVLCLADIRLLLVSETKPLSKSFINGFRSFWEVKNPNEPSRFNRLFSEYCIPLGDGSSLEFQSPMSHLSLFQPTANSTSMESGGWAGSRADLILFDDPISNSTVGTEDQREKSVVKYDAILELLEVGGFMHYNATPWHEEDLTARILERNEKSVDKALLYIIDPAWTALESGKGKDIFTLEESDVSLLFPARLTWKVLQQKLRDGDPKARTFRMQSLCMFLPEVEEDQKLQFDKKELQRHVLQFPEIPSSEDNVFASGDLGFSKSKYADPTAFTIFKIVETKLYVLWQEAGNWRDSEKAEKIVELQRRFPRIRKWAIEKYPSCERLDESVRNVAAKYGINAPSIYWWPAPNTTDRKFHYLKSVENYIAQGRIKFQAGAWNDDLFNELEKLDGTGVKRRSSTRKDDRGDSLSIGVSLFMPNPDDEDATARQKFEEEEQARRLMQEQYDMTFNGAFAKNVSSGRDWRFGIPTPESPSEDTYLESDRIGAFGIPCAPRFAGQSLTPNKKMVSFGDTIRKK